MADDPSEAWPRLRAARVTATHDARGLPIVLPTQAIRFTIFRDGRELSFEHTRSGAIGFAEAVIRLARGEKLREETYAVGGLPLDR